MAGDPSIRVERNRTAKPVAGKDPAGQQIAARPADLQGALLGATRRTTTLMQQVVQAAADRPGVNVTDLNCLNLLGLTGSMTAGDLARATGLTTASITGVADRLEKTGYARRERDPGDRRRVLVRLSTDAALHDVGPVFAPLILAWRDLAAGCMTQELELLVRFRLAGAIAMDRIFSDSAVERRPGTFAACRVRRCE